MSQLWLKANINSYRLGPYNSNFERPVEYDSARTDVTRGCADGTNASSNVTDGIIWRSTPYSIALLYSPLVGCSIESSIIEEGLSGYLSSTWRHASMAPARSFSSAHNVE